uniref:Potassium channel domain-containing protein n=1 Tax=Acrobeloides nanus TaxID=290746 RepID=A0A914C0T3_9BILA
MAKTFGRQWDLKSSQKDMSNDRIELSSIITISKSLPYRSLHDVRRKIIADKALEKSDAYLQQPTIQIGDRRAKDIIRQLRNRIETTLKKSKDEQEDIRTQAIAHALPRIAKISTELATIPEETNNIVKTDEFQQLTKLATNGISNGHSKEADQAEEDEEEEALLDEVAAQKPLYLVMFYTLQVACTIGWGDIVATNSISRVYTVAYTLLGAPVVFSGFANIGKVFDRNYTPDWQFLANVVRQKDPRKKTKVEMPYMKSINLLVWHTFIVCLINTEWIQNIGNINTAYFM